MTVERSLLKVGVEAGLDVGGGGGGGGGGGAEVVGGVDGFAKVVGGADVVRLREGAEELVGVLSKVGEGRSGPMNGGGSVSAAKRWFTGGLSKAITSFSSKPFSSETK